MAFLMGYFKIKLCVHLCISLSIENIHQLKHSGYISGVFLGGIFFYYLSFYSKAIHESLHHIVEVLYLGSQWKNYTHQDPLWSGDTI